MIASAVEKWGKMTQEERDATKQFEMRFATDPYFQHECLKATHNSFSKFDETTPGVVYKYEFGALLVELEENNRRAGLPFTEPLTEEQVG